MVNWEFWQLYPGPKNHPRRFSSRSCHHQHKQRIQTNKPEQAKNIWRIPTIWPCIDKSFCFTHSFSKVVFKRPETPPSLHTRESCGRPASNITTQKNDTRTQHIKGKTMKHNTWRASPLRNQMKQQLDLSSSSWSALCKGMFVLGIDKYVQGGEKRVWRLRKELW